MNPTGIVGIRVQVVTEVQPGSPADGVVQVGDRVVAVDGAEGTPQELRAMLLGADGAPITLTLERSGERLERTIERVPRP